MDMKIFSSINQTLRGLTKGLNASPDRMGQYWTGSVSVGASASNIVLTMQRRWFDYEVLGISIICINATAFTAQVGMTVIPVFGQTNLYETAVDIGFFTATGGTFNKDNMRPQIVKNTEDIKFLFTNRLGTAAICDVILYGLRTKTGELPAKDVPKLSSDV